MDEERERRKGRPRSSWDAVGVLVPAGLLIGMGIGWIFDEMVPGLFIGLGAGMLLMAVLHLALRK